MKPKFKQDERVNILNGSDMFDGYYPDRTNLKVRALIHHSENPIYSIWTKDEKDYWNISESSLEAYQPQTLQEIIEEHLAEILKEALEEAPAQPYSKYIAMPLHQSQQDEAEILEANSIEELEDKISASPELWNVQMIVYKAHREINSNVIVSTNKL